MEEITEAGFHAPTTQEDFRIPPQNIYNVSDVFDRIVFAEKLAMCETSTGITHGFIWMEEARQGTFPSLVLRVGPYWYGWRKIR